MSEADIYTYLGITAMFIAAFMCATDREERPEYFVYAPTLVTIIFCALSTLT